MCLAAVGTLIAGCASSRRSDGRFASDRGVSHGQTPWILTGPACILLTNADSFVAHILVTENGATEGRPPALSGELYCRLTRLYLVPDAPHSRSRHGYPDALSFIWNVSQGSGFALSEPLQGYAPIGSPLRLTNVLIEADSRIPPPDKIEGHRCAREIITVVSGEGYTNQFEAWRAPDLKNVRLKIISRVGDAPFKVTLSQVRLGSLPLAMFEPPPGFTPYASLMAMQNELAQRELNQRRRLESELPENSQPTWQEKNRKPGTQPGE